MRCSQVTARSVCGSYVACFGSEFSETLHCTSVKSSQNGYATIHIDDLSGVNLIDIPQRERFIQQKTWTQLMIRGIGK